MRIGGRIPKGQPKTVVIDPGISSGRPAIAGTGILISVIGGRLNAGETIEELAHDYGLKLADMLRAAGLRVEVHDDHFRRDAPDPEWLRQCGKREWTVITADKAI